MQAEKLLSSLRGGEQAGKGNPGKEAAWSPPISPLPADGVSPVEQPQRPPLRLAERPSVPQLPAPVCVLGEAHHWSCPAPPFPRPGGPPTCVWGGEGKGDHFQLLSGLPPLPEVRADCPGWRSGLDLITLWRDRPQVRLSVPRDWALSVHHTAASGRLPHPCPSLPQP